VTLERISPSTICCDFSGLDEISRSQVLRKVCPALLKAQVLPSDYKSCEYILFRHSYKFGMNSDRRSFDDQELNDQSCSIWVVTVETRLLNLSEWSIGGRRMKKLCKCTARAVLRQDKAGRQFWQPRNHENNWVPADEKGKPFFPRGRLLHLSTASSSRKCAPPRRELPNTIFPLQIGI
jgi:hypothetical protein